MRSSCPSSKSRKYSASSLSNLNNINPLEVVGRVLCDAELIVLYRNWTAYHCIRIPENTKHVYNLRKMSHQRWTDAVQMLCKCFVFAGIQAVETATCCEPSLFKGIKRTYCEHTVSDRLSSNANDQIHCSYLLSVTFLRDKANLC